MLLLVFVVNIISIILFVRSVMIILLAVDGVDISMPFDLCFVTYQTKLERRTFNQN